LLRQEAKKIEKIEERYERPTGGILCENYAIIASVILIDRSQFINCIAREGWIGATAEMRFRAFGTDPGALAPN